VTGGTRGLRLLDLGVTGHAHQSVVLRGRLPLSPRMYKTASSFGTVPFMRWGPPLPARCLISSTAGRALSECSEWIVIPFLD
jgi:hypothetical protein